jgi:hypothetical protein
MLKSICTQLWNRRRFNGTILVELVLVFCLVWYMTDYFFVYVCNTRIASHRDLHHTWRLNLALFPENHPDFLPGENTPDALAAHYRRILQTVHSYPGVEAVSVCDQWSPPASGNYTGGGYYRESDTSLVVFGQKISFYPQEDFFRVFRHTRNEGRDAASTADFDWGDPQAILISRSVEQQLFPRDDARGKVILRRPYHEADSSSLRHVVAGVVDDIKRFHYTRPQYAFYLPVTLKEAADYRSAVVSVRSSASLPDALFRENFGEAMSRSLRVGNFYLKSIAPYTTLEANIARTFGITGEIRARLYLMVFFLLNILLCTMGTFWYSVNLRRSEVGLRKALGATNAGIRASFLAEGLCLLAAGAAIAMLIEIQLIGAGLTETLGYRSDMPQVYLPDRTWLRFLITNAITAALLAAVILTAVWLPARRAAALPPAEALSAESS